MVSAQPAATSILAMSTGPASAPRTTRLPGVGPSSPLRSDACTTRRPPVSAVSGMPAKPGTPVAADTPGTISTRTRALAHASACSEARLNRSGSPANRRTASRPALAASISLPVSVPGSAGSAITARSGSRWASGPVSSGLPTTRSAWASSSAARSVSSPSSPGPTPTKATSPAVAGGASGLLVAGVGFTGHRPRCSCVLQPPSGTFPPRGRAIHERPGVPGPRPPRRGRPRSRPAAGRRHPR